MELDLESNGIIDAATPFGEHLSGKYRCSFAYFTIKERLPVILTNIIDQLARNKDSLIASTNCSPEDLKLVIGEISKLKYELQTNKSLELFSNKLPDHELWNNHLIELTNQNLVAPKFFNTIFMLTECHMYRKIAEIFRQTRTLTNHDPFREQKTTSFADSYAAIQTMSLYMNKLLNSSNDLLSFDRSEFIKLLKLNLWGNKCDLSLSLGKQSGQLTDPIEALKSLNEFLLVNETDAICDVLLSSDTESTIDLVHDNAGYELFTDFCIADYLVRTKLVKRVRFHVKMLPWFLSDVMSYDFHWMLERMCQDDDVNVVELSKRWSNYLVSGHWQLEVDEMFWTLPFGYEAMSRVDPNLFAKLAQSTLVIIKGDLSYRKLLNDFNWEPTTKFASAIQSFRPTNVCSLRTLKADLICGLDEGTYERMTKLHDNKWLVSGEFGIIQCARKED